MQLNILTRLLTHTRRHTSQYMSTYCFQRGSPVEFCKYSVSTNELHPGPIAVFLRTWPADR
jgi:hypothetical protein